jgi:hypothetical protein
MSRKKGSLGGINSAASLGGDHRGRRPARPHCGSSCSNRVNLARCWVAPTLRALARGPSQGRGTFQHPGSQALLSSVQRGTIELPAGAAVNRFQTDGWADPLSAMVGTPGNDCCAWPDASATGYHPPCLSRPTPLRKTHVDLPADDCRSGFRRYGMSDQCTWRDAG